VDSSTSRSTPWHTRWSISVTTAAKVAVTSHTFWVRRPARDSCGSRMHTIPEPLATSIAAARLITCTGSSVTSAPASPGTGGDAGLLLVLAMNNHTLSWKATR